MIAAALTYMLTFALSAGQSPETYRVFELASPAKPGLYRFRLSDEMVEMWNSQRRLGAFDAAGDPLPCEWLGSLPLQNIRKTYILQGNWLSDEVAWSLPAVGQFPFNAVWRFNVPQTAKVELSTVLRFSWHSTIDDTGLVQFVTGHDDRPGNRRRLREGTLNATGTGGNIGLHIGDEYPYPHEALPPVAELRFSLVSDEIAIDAPTLETATVRPWVHEVPHEPGWYVFHGNGKTPYRVQTGQNVDFCSGLAADRDSNNPDPNWPPEATVSRKVLDSPRLGRKP
jgi:hypothetical protein